MKTSTKIYLGLTGVLLVVLGIIAILHQGATLLSTAWLIGLLTLLSGLSTLCFGLSAQALLPNAGSVTLSGVVQVLVGLFFLLHNFAVAAALPFIFATWIIFESVYLAVRSFDYKRAGFPLWWLQLLLGIGGAILGFLALRQPAEAAATLTLLIGCGVIAAGVTRLIALAGLSRFEKMLKR